MPPNPRMQRTPSAPLMRQPLGAGKRRDLALAAVAIATVCACSTYPRSCPENDSWPASPKSLVRQTSLAEIRHKESEELAPLAGPARDALQRQLDHEIAQFESKLQPGDQIWFYRERKCDHCTWYREGYLALRECALVGIVLAQEDM